MSGFACYPTDHPVNATRSIWHPTVPRDRFAVVLFRRRVRLERAARPRLLVTASQRFWLSCDGVPLAEGPSRGDPDRWGVVSVRLPRLEAGEHVLAIRVWQAAEHSGVGQMGVPSFLLVAGGDAAGRSFSTDEPWRCTEDRSRRPIARHAWGRQRPYYVVGCGERIDAASVPWDWEHPGHRDGHWPLARRVASDVANLWGNLPLRCQLRPEPLPAMERRCERFARVASAPGDLVVAATAWIAGEGPLRVPAHSRLRLILDRGELTNAEPELHLAGGAGARIDSIAAEAPFTGVGHAKGDRDDLRGKRLYGHRDRWLAPGGRRVRALRPLWFRSFRYLQLDIRTVDQALVLADIRCHAVGFPLRSRIPMRAIPSHDDWPRLWELSWRTLRLCAHETFFDCPHYEQAQFPGDTRVQAMAHYLLADDDRLARKAIDDFHASRHADGMLECRWPSTRQQILPTFALAWIGMLHDFRLQRGDHAFLQAYLPAAREVLDWFLRRRRDDGLLGRIPHAPFVDWTAGFACGNAPQGDDGGSALLSLQLAEACRWLAGMETACGWAELAPRWRREAAALGAAVLATCADGEQGLIADTPGRTSTSVHTQVHAVLSGTVGRERGRRMLLAALSDPEVIQAGTFYFRYHILQALIAVGAGKRFCDLLLPAWRTCLQGTGLSTWPETAGPTPRSDCHAWSVTPAIALVQLGLLQGP